ncbi:sigma-54 interaction domain-containing protein [Paraflavitalea pollutisoli]|uniref:sigma-54 interaction domain-containing protein n=1 Tax=Paraflavitalea pollutisoli TaxID=3034143 RepID=UPI0023EB521E|nr:sigma-54 dependent transcriptional regulator [Paraflavitalea sp. H1-2-19X]
MTDSRTSQQPFLNQQPGPSNTTAAVFPQVIGHGPAMQQVYKLVSMVAKADSTVLLLGETGTGKEVIARAIHQSSMRHDKPMVKVNCAALPANLIESELFGHERGAFTGATDRRVGKFEMANQGTIFLDEIGEIPVEIQVKLLRVLQEREFERIGGKTTIKTNVRVIAATNRDLVAEIKAGRFRADLYYRLHVFPISLPPLRERKEDIAPLTTYFLDRYSKATGKKVTGVTTHQLQALEAYAWPGNVRELEHLIERSVLLAREPVLNDIYLPQPSPMKEEPQLVPVPDKSLHEMERSYIIQALRKYHGRIGGADGAAQFLSIPSTTLHSKIKKLAITKKDYLQG